jgi:hypothetical protein
LEIGLYGDVLYFVIRECWLDTSENNLRRGRDKQNIAMGINMIQSLDIVSMIKEREGC